MRFRSLVAGTCLTGLSLLGASCEKGGGNKDAEAFCDCYSKLRAEVDDQKCDDDMEALEKGFKRDKDRYDQFRAAAMKQCPEAKDVIYRMR